MRVTARLASEWECGLRNAHTVQCRHMCQVTQVSTIKSSIKQVFGVGAGGVIDKKAELSYTSSHEPSQPGFLKTIHEGSGIFAFFFNFNLL